MKKYGVVGAGLVGSIFKELDSFEVVHRNEWKDKIRGWAGVVNCAAITGLEQCENTDFAHVLRANVRMPLEISDYAALVRIPFIQFSTSAVYARSPEDKPVDEYAPVYPYNNYASSKILMEATLTQRDIYIFRIPAVYIGSGADNDFDQKVKRWTQVEDVMISLVYKDTLIKAVKNAMALDIPGGIFNIASETVHLPTYIKERYGWEGEIIPAHALNRSPAIQLDTTKAEQAGLI